VENAAKLAQWILANVPYRREGMTHLKLQKLAFYCYGAALAFDCDGDVGSDVTFEAWEHGPVCRDVWQTYKGFKGTVIPWLAADAAPTYGAEATRRMRDALAVYGAMNAWSLRQESHLEAPWVAHSKAADVIPTEELRQHFHRKFAAGTVQFPEYLLHGSSAQLDGIPVRGCGSLEELATIVERIANVSEG
jgi:uncharacterized phage-associated protein